MAAQLIITEPSGRRRIIPLSKTAPVSIGRGTGNGVILFDPEVSRKHCSVAWDGSDFVVEDHGSQNGTYLNNRPIRSRERIGDKDEIAIGHCKMKFILVWEGKGVSGEGRLGRKLASACVVVLVVGLGGALGFVSHSFTRASAAAPAAAEGPVVKTTPSGATVFVNDQFIGVSPVKLTQGKGRYSLRVQLAGYKAASQAISIESGSPDVLIELQAVAMAFLNVSSEPSDAEVLLDTDRAGKTPIKVRTTPGTHEIVLQKTNYVNWKGSVEVEPGATLNVAEGLELRDVAAYIELLQEDSNNVSYYCELGHVFILEERIAEASDAFRKAMEIFCQGKDTSNYAGRLKWEFDKIYFGDYFDVADKEKHEEIRTWIISLYAEMMKKYPEQKQNLLTWLTEILKRAGRVDELNKFIEAAQDEPDLTMYFEAADQYLEKGQFQQAVGILNRAVNLGPKSCKAHAKLGQACLLWCKNGKKEVKEDAVKNLEKAVGLCNDEAEKQKIQALLQQAMKL